MSEKETYCGFIIIIGRQNVGKSTLLNSLLGQKISITSCKPHTTRHCIIGIHTKNPYQVVYIDTPGFHTKRNSDTSYLVNKPINSLKNEIELVIFLVEGTRWTLDDEILLNRLRNIKKPVILAINKVDKIQKKTILLPHLQWLSTQMNFLDIIPLSAKTGLNVDIMMNVVHTHLPKGIYRFPKECITHCSQPFIASEIVREKLMRFFGDELPYSLTVKIEHFKKNKCGSYSIAGLILVAHKRQKKIIIGSGGTKIKTICMTARYDMQKIFCTLVHLKLQVKLMKPRT